MVMDTINKVKEARLKITLDYDEMLDVKKYMFKELLESKSNDVETNKKDIEYVNSLNNLNPSHLDESKLSPLGVEIMFIIFSGYISIVSSKQCGEDFTINKPVRDNEVDFKKYECNVMKRMYLKYKAQTTDFISESTVDMVRQQFEFMEKFGENFFAFKLSENRSLLLVNSFFRLYFDDYTDKKNFLDLDIAKFSDIPSFSAIAPNNAILTETRRYKYEIHEIDLDSVDYINELC